MYIPWHILTMKTLKWTTSMPYTSPTVRIVPILTTPADTIHTRNSEIGSTRDPRQPTSTMPSCASRARDVENAKGRWLAPSTTKMAPVERCDLSTMNAWSAACVHRSSTRVRQPRATARTVTDARDDGDIESRRLSSHSLTWRRVIKIASSESMHTEHDTAWCAWVARQGASDWRGVTHRLVCA